MRLLESNKTRSIYDIINEELRNGKAVIVAKTGLDASDNKAKEILHSVIGQMSDGIWENTPGYDRYWKNIDVSEEDGEIVIYGGTAYGSPFLDYHSSTGVKDASAVRNFMAHKIKQIVKIEAEDGNHNIVWKRDCETPLSYLGYNESITVKDCYRVYDKLLGRIDRIEESDDFVFQRERDMNDLIGSTEGRDDLQDKADEVIKNINKDEYIEYDDETNWSAEEASDADERFENRYMSGGNGATFNESASRVIWTSETNEDDYDKEELKSNQYQDYLNNFDGTIQPESYDNWLDSEWLGDYLYHEFNSEDNEYEEWYDFISNYPEEDLKRYYQDYLDDINEREPNKPKEFDEWFEDYFVDDADNQWQYREEDLRDNVLPMIDKQVNGAIFITGNYNSNYSEFKKSGPGGKIVKDGDALINWLSNEDRLDITNEEGDQVGVYASDHDGSIGGLLFTLPDDPHKVLEIALSTDYYDKNDYADNNGIIEDFMYDLSNDNVSMKDIKKPELLVPIKNGFLLEESAKPKKEKKSEERVIMQQGNVTCLKKDNKFKVFEDTDSNLVEYDNQEEAMRDALSRCGVNPDDELSEEKDNLKEQVDEALKTLLKKKDDLYKDESISDDEYYRQVDMIDNLIINNYEVSEIEAAEKELGINSEE